MAEIFNSGQFQAIGNDGKVVPYGKLYFYEAGTLTSVNSYTTALKDATNPIPVVLSASGKADVFLDDGVIDIVLKDSLDVVVWTIENFKNSNTFDNTGTGLTSTNNQDAIIEVLGTTHFPIGTIADFRLMTETPKYVYVTGYHTANDNAFDSNFFKLMNSAATDNSGTIIVPTGITTYHYALQYSGAVNAESFGAVGDGTTDDTASLIKGMIKDSLLLDLTKTYLFNGLHIRGDIYSAFVNTKNVDLTRTSEFDEVTKEYIDANGEVWALQFRQGNMALPKMFNGWDATQLTKAIYSGTATVTMVGTSITEGEDAQAEQLNMWANALKESLQDMYPTVTWVWKNLGLNSTRLSMYVDPAYLALASAPASVFDGFYRTATVDTWPDGSTTGQNWMWHVEQTAPDLLVIAFGMNDTSTNKVFSDNLKLAIDNAKTYTKIPSIALVSEIGRSDTNSERIKSYSRLTSYLAKNYGLGLIDAGRYWEYLRTGKDERSIIAQRVNSIVDWEAHTNIPDAITYNSLEMTTALSCQMIKRGYYTGASFLCYFNPYNTASIAFFSVGINGSAGYADTGLTVLRKDTRFLIYDELGVVAYTISGLTAVAVGVVEKLVVRMVGNKIEIWQNSILIGTFFNDANGYYGGVSIGVNNGILTTIQIDIATPKYLGTPKFDDSALNGRYSDWNSLANYEDGGNNLNHPSRYGLAYAFKNAILDFLDSVYSISKNGAVFQQIGDTDITINSTTTASTGMEITVVMPTAGVVTIDAIFPFMNPPTNVNRGIMYLYRDTTILDTRVLRINPIAANYYNSETIVFNHTENVQAGTYVYKISWKCLDASDTMLSTSGTYSVIDRVLRVSAR